MPTIVESYYDQNAEGEWSRLDRHRTELAVTLRALSRWLPPAPAAVLDLGGGPGRYAIALTQQGYRVTLADISAASLALAENKAQQAGVAIHRILNASALDLSALGSGRFDAVLLMGPLYHLLEEDERAQAVRQARRVLKPEGVIFASFITRFAPFRDAAVKYPEIMSDDPAYAEHVLTTGMHDQARGFTRAYFAHPDEVIPLMEGAGFETLALIGCEGVVAGHEERIRQLQGPAWEYWVDLNFRLGQEPSLRGAADHLLYIGRRMP